LAVIYRRPRPPGINFLKNINKIKSLKLLDSFGVAGMSIAEVMENKMPAGF
jgi:hypothetical protein